jgi:hypothetical protein
MNQLLTKMTTGLCAMVIVGSAMSGQHGHSGGGGGQSGSSAHSGTHTSQYTPASGSGSKSGSSGKSSGPSSAKTVKPSSAKSASSASSGNKPWQPKQLNPQQKQHIEKFVLQQQGKLSAQQQGAFNQLLSGGELSFENRNTLTDLLASQSELSPELRQSISEGLKDDEDNRRAAGIVQDRRYLKIKNATPEPLRVFVQYQTRLADDKWAWYPEPPKESSKATSFLIEPGKVTYLEIDKWRLNASRIRVWAKSTTSGTEWMEYKNQDLWLVPEVDEEKHHRYYAAEMESYPFDFTL